ncbi:MAG: DNA polymerase III subunit beta [Planctomycetes bacterium]|nr:DNA polymerase III subunit beta [Planctomycetota bacterium]
MKVVLDRQPFVEVLSNLSLLAPSRPTTPILGAVKLSTDSKGKTPYFNLYTTDFEISVSVKCQIKKIMDEGTLILPIGKLLPILRELQSDDVTLESDLAVGLISVEQESYKIVGLSEAEYPDQSAPSEQTTNVVLPKEQLTEAIKKVLISVSNEPIRYCLSGIRINITDDKVNFISTDGRRISLLETNPEKKSQTNLGTTVPPKALQLLRKFIQESEVANIAISENYSKFTSKTFEIFARSIEGSYPDVKAAIPELHKIKAELNRSDFLSCLNRISLVTNRETRAVTLTLENNKLTLEGQEAGASEGKAVMKCNTLNGSGLKIRFKIDYLLDFLNNSDSEKIIVQFNSNTEIATFNEPDNKNYTYLLMPIVLRDEAE